MMLLKPDARRVLCILIDRMTLDDHRVMMTQAQIIEVANDLAEVDDSLAELRTLDRARVSRAAKELQKAGIASYTKKGGFWTVDPTIVQFGNVLHNAALAPKFEIEGDEDEFGLRDFTDEELADIEANRTSNERFEIGQKENVDDIEFGIDCRSPKRRAQSR